MPELEDNPYDLEALLLLVEGEDSVLYVKCRGVGTVRAGDKLKLKHKGDDFESDLKRIQNDFYYGKFDEFPTRGPGDQGLSVISLTVIVDIGTETPAMTTNELVIVVDPVRVVDSKE